MRFSSLAGCPNSNLVVEVDSDELDEHSCDRMFVDELVVVDVLTCDAPLMHTHHACQQSCEAPRP